MTYAAPVNAAMAAGRDAEASAEDRALGVDEDAEIAERGYAGA